MFNFKGENLHCFGQPMSGLVENFNIGIFSDTINIMYNKLCIMVLHIEPYLFITLSVTLTLFQSYTAMLNNFN